MRKMRYTVVHEYSIFQLGLSVNKSISEGWKPIGGASAVLVPVSSVVYMQAMIKEQDDEIDH